MKKLMMTAAIVCAAVAANAATTQWAISDIVIDGTADSFEDFYGDPPVAATRAPAGWQVYLFDNNGTYSQAQMAALIAGCTSDAGVTAWKSAMSSYADVGTVGDMEGFSGFDTRETANVTGADTVSAYLVMIDASDLDEASKVWISSVESAAVNPMSVADLTGMADEDPTGFGYGNMGYLDARGYAETTGGWSTVPEPTSGLLLLLGVAGLALRRRRA